MAFFQKDPVGDRLRFWFCVLGLVGSTVVIGLSLVSSAMAAEPTTAPTFHLCDDGSTFPQIYTSPNPAGPTDAVQQWRSHLFYVTTSPTDSVSAHLQALRNSESYNCRNLGYYLWQMMNNDATAATDQGSSLDSIESDIAAVKTNTADLAASTGATSTHDTQESIMFLAGCVCAMCACWPLSRAFVL